MLTEQEVRHVAMLARLGLTDEEVEKMGGQLAQVLNYIAVLQQVDTSQVPPTAHAGEQSDVMRPDQARPSLPNNRVIANAPAHEGDFFAVPAVLDDNAPDLAHRDGGKEAPDA